MIQQKTFLKVSDNSGAKTVKCLKILGGFKKKYAKLGDTIIISIQKLKDKQQQIQNKQKKFLKVKKKEIYKALILRTITRDRKKTGCEMLFKENTVALMDKKGNPIGTRIVGPLPRHFKKRKLQKFINISAGLI